MTEKEQIFAYKELRNNGQVLIVNNYEDADRIIEALEKQIPKEPIPQDEDCLECPNCDSFIGYASECKDEHYRVEYCPNCGQSLKWGE